MSRLYTPKGFVVTVVVGSFLCGILMTAIASRHDALAATEALSVFVSSFAIAALFLVPVFFINYIIQRALWGPSKPKPPKELPTTRGQTVLEAEYHRLSEVHLDEIHNLHEYTRINLGLNELRTIDLSPLAGSTSLKELILYMNQLESIDLTPLTSCPNLEYLDLTCNNLEMIDLTPLSSCLKLTGLNIGANRTSQLNLSPISECRDMEVLNIDGMNLREIDLSPLKGFTKLWFLKLDDNEFTSLDITPLFECELLTEFNIDRIELTTTLMRDVDEWPKGIRKHKKKFRNSS